MYPQPVVLLTVSNAQMVSLYDNMLVKFVNCPSDLCAAGGAVAGGGGRREEENHSDEQLKIYIVHASGKEAGLS